MVFPSKYLATLLFVSALSFAGKERVRICLREVVIAPAQGMEGGRLERHILDNTGMWKPYYPRSQKQLREIPVKELLPEQLEFTRSLALQTVHSIFLIPDSGEPVYGTAASRSGDSFEVADLLGRRVVYQSSGGSAYHRVERSESSLTPIIAIDPKDVVNRDFKIPADHEAFAQRLARKQLSYSVSYRSPESAQRRIFDAQVSLNRILLEKINAAESITPEEAQNWTRSILNASPSPDWQEAHSYWVIRGTRFEYVEDKSLYKIDLRGRQFTGVGVIPGLYFQAFPADEVPDRLEGVLAEINRVSRRTKFAKAVIAGHNYMRLHSTIDGNGRVGRAIMDFCMLKAGYAPIPEIPEEKFPPFFVTDDDVVQIVLSGFL